MELREHERIPVSLPVSFSGDQIVGEGQVLNISVCGCGIESDRNVQKGTFLDLRVQLPEPETPIEVELAAVRWSLGQKFGLEFLRMRSEEQERLRRILKNAPKQAAC
jgi:hypothetical protein